MNTAPKIEALSVPQACEILASQIRQIGPLVIEAEIRGMKLHKPSGHRYFQAVGGEGEEKASLDAAIWKGTLPAPKLRGLTEGQQVLLLGTPSFYAPRGKITFHVEDLQSLAQEGDREKQIRETYERLRAEGLFDESVKRPVPGYPMSGVLIITSSGSSAMRDVEAMRNAMAPQIPAWLIHTGTQGPQAAPAIARALHQANLAKPTPDTVLLVRGGGSKEDLDAFNEEIVCRAIRSTRAPVISGIGHENDWTLADYAADLRAPTPTGAAAAALPDSRGLRDQLQKLLGALRAHTRNQWAFGSERAREALHRASMSLQNTLREKQSLLEAAYTRLEALSPGSALRRGYALVSRDTGEAISSTEQMRSGQAQGFQIRFHDGIVPVSRDS